MNESQLEVVPGMKFEPAFSNPEDYEKFRERYISEVTPKLAQSRLARAMSEHESINRIVK